MNQRIADLIILLIMSNLALLIFGLGYILITGNKLPVHTMLILFWYNAGLITTYMFYELIKIK